MKKKYELFYLIIVCLAPLLNLLFDYFVLDRTPTIFSISITIFTLIVMVVCIFVFFVKKDDNN